MQKETQEQMKYEIRHLTTGDLEQYNALLRYAFQITEQELLETGWRDDEIKQSKFPVLERADVMGCFDGETLISQFASYPLEMNIYGKKFEIGFVTSVCTYPEYSGNGIMKQLMIQSMTNMRDKGKSFALLYPYSIPLYHKLGWEIVSNKISYTIKDTQLPKQQITTGYVRRVDWENADFKNLHTRFAAVTHGCLYRNALAWEEYWRWDEDDTNVAIYYDQMGQPCGYMVYLIKLNVMHIKEMIYLNREAHKGLWAYIHAHESMIDEIRGNTYFSEPIAFEMDDGDIKEMIRPYCMGRIVDVRQFFEKYPCDPDEKPVRIGFEIKDELLPWNNEDIIVLFENGKCKIVDEPADYSVKLSIGTLTALLLGYKTASRLLELERISGTKEAIDRLDDVVFHKIPYISDYI